MSEIQEKEHMRPQPGPRVDGDPFVLYFDEKDADSLELVGGKGANLSRLTQADLPVPPGYIITTAAYRQFVTENRLVDQIDGILDRVDYQDSELLETLSAEIRSLLHGASIPAGIAASIDAAYRRLGDDLYVAVRSSGTAEDLAEASFAGMHDTYLDIRGPDELLMAVKRCWASLWTARATAYRKNMGFDHNDVKLAVVVQIMVEADVAGVMFTGNPMTASNNEIVVNASWGLGEAVVSGIVTPDQYVLNAGTLNVKERLLGDKALRIARDSSRRSGTVTTPVDEDGRRASSLDDEQLRELGDLGLQVTSYYGGMPQDMEWAYTDGCFYLLQSRPITGVNFAWTEDMETWQVGADNDTDVWSRSWSDEVWTGAITPLMYSWRGALYTEGHVNCMRLWGMPELAGIRRWKYSKGTAYHNCDVQKELIKTAWPPFRKGELTHVAPDKRDEVLGAPFSLLNYVRMHLRIKMRESSASVGAWLNHQYREFIDNKVFIERSNGLSSDALRALPDEALIAYTDDAIDLERVYFRDMWSGFHLHARDSISLLAWIVEHWYDGANKMAFNDVITGVPKRTSTMDENVRLWGLTEHIRKSADLLQTFREHQGSAFFAALEETDSGRAFLMDYRAFIADYGHRGQADRDIYYPRRSEDLSVDYNAFSAFLSSDISADPTARENETNGKRNAATGEVAANLRLKPLGFLRVRLFKAVLDYVQQFLMYRDNERDLTDRITFSVKRGFLEINRRLLDRGTLPNQEDYFFLSREELYSLFQGHADPVITRAKIAGRSLDFHRFLNREFIPPMYISGGGTVSFESDNQALGDGHWRGTGTSSGTVSGTARVIRSLKDIGRVAKGEILITNSTDPGWTPVFMLIKGIVLETGGMLAHGSCLAREYGLPAIQLENAMELIPDGCEITITGDTGDVLVNLADGTV